MPSDRIHGALRLTFGEANTQEDVARLLDVLPGIVERARQLQV